jgi:hypothetical protein
MCQTVARENPFAKPLEIQTGIAIPGRNTTEGSAVVDDPALANSMVLSREMLRNRKAQGVTVKASNVGFDVLVAKAKLELTTDGDEIKYIRTEPKLMIGPTPLSVCATTEMLKALCSKQEFQFVMWDFTFFCVSGKVDCFDAHTMDFSECSMIALPLVRVFAVAKTADAHERYFWEVDKACEREGLSLSWGRGMSIGMGVIDMHQGQALGLLRYLMGKYGVEEGARIFLEIMRACRTHHTSIPRKAIALSKFDDDKIAQAWDLYHIITALQSTRDQVDAAFAELAEMSEPLRRSMEFLSR